MTDKRFTRKELKWDEDKHAEALERRETKLLYAKLNETVDETICKITNNAFCEYNKQAILETVTSLEDNNDNI